MGEPGRTEAFLRLSNTRGGWIENRYGRVTDIKHWSGDTGVSYRDIDLYLRWEESGERFLRFQREAFLLVTVKRHDMRATYELAATDGSPSRPLFIQDGYYVTVEIGAENSPPFRVVLFLRMYVRSARSDSYGTYEDIWCSHSIVNRL